MWDITTLLNLAAPLTPALWYATCCVTGRQVWLGEERRLKHWLRTGERPDRGSRFGFFTYDTRSTLSNHGLMGSAGAIDIASRYSNDGKPFVAINYDHYQGSWWLGLRLRRLVDQLARREGIPVIPVPFTPWRQVDARELRIDVVERKGRECVFARINENDTRDYFLSGYDTNEATLRPRGRHGLYFLTKLPRPADSIQDAREALKPASVLLAESEGRKIYRQGDMFAIETSITDGDIRDAGGTIRQRVPLYGTAHTADWVATLANGTQFAWGEMVHCPAIIEQGRLPDHRPLPLKPKGKTWYLVAKNATPMQPPKRGGRWKP